MRPLFVTGLLTTIATLAVAQAPVKPPAPRVLQAGACTDLPAVKRGDTPEALWPVVVKCIRSGELDKAVRVSAVASVYTKFDTYRVLDETAHQAVNSLPATYLGSLPPAEVEQFMGRMQAYGGGSPQHKAMCASIARIGPPDYFPVYMIQNGMDATNKPSGSALKKDFNVAAAWKESLVGYLRCDGV